MKRSKVPSELRPTSSDSASAPAAPAPAPSHKKSRQGNVEATPDTTTLESSSYATTVAATPASDKYTSASAKSPFDVAVAAKSGHGARIRLPDKLMEYLNGQVEPDVLWWQNDEGFAFDSTRVQTDFLDKHFEKTKLKSFIRSLNRWGFRRIFFHTLPKKIYTFSHPLFKKDNPDLAKDMKMVSYSGQQQAEMEEFNRQRKGEVVKVEPSAQQPQQQQAATLLSPVSTQPVALSPASMLQQPIHPTGAVNPMERLPGQLDAQQLQLLQQHQLQQQLAQRLDQQSMAQAAFFQSMLNMVPQPQAQQQQSLLVQALLTGQQQQQQQQPPSQAGLPTNLPEYQLQHQQQNALSHFLSAQGRLDTRQQQNTTSQHTNSTSQEESKDRASASTAPTIASDESDQQQQQVQQRPQPKNQ